MRTTIERASAELLRVRLATPRVPGLTGFDLITVDLTDADGRTGFGFTFVPGDGGDVHLAAARSMLDRFVAGRTVDAPQALWREIFASLNRTGRGAHLIALTAIDVAAWDLHAKRLGLPIGIAMGGAPRRVPVYGSGGFTHLQESGEAVAIAAEWCRKGARGVKLRVGGSHDAALLQAVAAALPPGIALMTDANERCTLSGAHKLLFECADAGALWLEEPLPATQLAGYQLLARTAPVAIATGEHLQGCVETAPFVFGKACSVFQPDLAMMGGLTECLRATQLAEHADVEVAPHCLPGLFVHLAAAAPNITWLEDFPFVEEVLSGLPEMDADGTMGLPDSPGHGLTLAAGAREEFLIRST
jgi:L-alanine-DL-glutamate epimerase-like enolase superfamily enzyme